MDILPMKEYCPRSPYGWQLEDIINQIVQKEDELNHPVEVLELPLYVPPEVAPMKDAPLYAFIKSILP